jgi:hypothetical protein
MSSLEFIGILFANGQKIGPVRASFVKNDPQKYIETGVKLLDEVIPSEYNIPEGNYETRVGKGLRGKTIFYMIDSESFTDIDRFIRLCEDTKRAATPLDHNHYWNITQKWRDGSIELGIVCTIKTEEGNVVAWKIEKWNNGKTKVLEVGRTAKLTPAIFEERLLHHLLRESDDDFGSISSLQKAILDRMKELN